MAISKVRASSTAWPAAKMSWETVLPDELDGVTPEVMLNMHLLYNNLMYDLVGAAMSKLGLEYSKLISGQIDQKTFDECMCCVKKALAE